MATETETLPAAVGSLSLAGEPRKITPLEPSGVLDKYQPVDLTPAAGRQFETVELSDLLDAPNADELLKELAITIHRRVVVFFKKQQKALTDDQLKRLARKLGTLTGGEGYLHIHPTEIGREDNEISPIQAESFKRSRDKRSALASNGWHTDITFEPVPSDIAILTLTQIPESGGGDTLWASAYEAYDRLTPAFGKWLEGFTAEHSGEQFHQVAALRGTPLYTDVRGHPSNKGDHLKAIHPVIRINPVTGWKGLFVNPVFTKRIVELSFDESAVVLNYLFTLIKDNHNLQVRFKWDKNDVALWSNTSSFHNVTVDYQGIDRVGHRAVSLGDKPYFHPDAGGRSRREALGLPMWLEE
ncbi:TauD/TfdA dioxygenase family protein [Rhodotorula paludigena]|uniref:TauD/TfdA dioxygenase family protein n=1 Tax=Rhodotorula paludigena TaxID=86838 RepID=UPI00316F6812